MKERLDEARKELQDEIDKIRERDDLDPRTPVEDSRSLVTKKRTAAAFWLGF